MLSTFRRRAVLGIAVLAMVIGLSARPAAAQTNIVADDIAPTAGHTGQSVTSFTFSTANFNPTTVTVTPTVYFYDSTGSGGGPGTLLDDINFGPLALSAGSVQLYTYTPGTPIFTLPSGFFWAGISFNSTTATTAQLNNVGQGLFAPPTVGSSQNAFFLSSSPATTANDPAGSIVFFGGNPVADFGWSFNVGGTTVYSDTTHFEGSGYANGGAVAAVTTPEPSPVAPFALGALSLTGLMIVARRKKAALLA